MDRTQYEEARAALRVFAAGIADVVPGAHADVSERDYLSTDAGPYRYLQVHVDLPVGAMLVDAAMRAVNVAVAVRASVSLSFFDRVRGRVLLVASRVLDEGEVASARARMVEGAKSIDRPASSFVSVEVAP